MLFKTYTNVFKVNQTEHTLLYYLYKLEQVYKHYKMLDVVQIVANDLLKKAHCMKQEEPTIVDAHHQVPDEANSPRPSYERIDSPNPGMGKPGSLPFKISLLEMPLDPGSAKKDANKQQ